MRDHGNISFVAVERSALVNAAITQIIKAVQPINLPACGKVRALVGDLITLPGGITTSLIPLIQSDTGVHVDSGDLPGISTALAPFGNFKGCVLGLVGLQLAIERPHMLIERLFQGGLCGEITIGLLNRLSKGNTGLQRLVSVLKF